MDLTESESILIGQRRRWPWLVGGFTAGCLAMVGLAWGLAATGHFNLIYGLMRYHLGVPASMLTAEPPEPEPELRPFARAAEPDAGEPDAGEPDAGEPQEVSDAAAEPDGGASEGSEVAEAESSGDDGAEPEESARDRRRARRRARQRRERRRSKRGSMGALSDIQL